MKALTVAIVGLAFSTSLWAQGEFCSGLTVIDLYENQSLPTSDPCEPSTGVLMLAYDPVFVSSGSQSIQPPSTFMEVQVVPEPTSVAMGSLALGLIIVRQVVHRGRPLK
jgi:hypothetical protein